MALGEEMQLDDALSGLERFYIRVFGVPINGLRIRARRILPLIHARYRHVLDAGCGPGVFTFELARRLPGAEVTGIDIEEPLITRNTRMAQRLGLKNCRFQCQDITTMTVQGAYDLVLTVDNLEHIEDDDLALQKFYDALAPGGELLMHVPGYERRWLFLGWAVNFDVKGHFRPGYRLEDLEEKIRKTGFQIVRSQYTYGWLETVTNNISYLITGAEMRRRHLYALVFPWLSLISFFGQWSRPVKGAGVLLTARKP